VPKTPFLRLGTFSCAVPHIHFQYDIPNKDNIFLKQSNHKPYNRDSLFPRNDAGQHIHVSA